MATATSTMQADPAVVWATQDGEMSLSPPPATLVEVQGVASTGRQLRSTDVAEEGAMSLSHDAIPSPLVHAQSVEDTDGRAFVRVESVEENAFASIPTNEPPREAVAVQVETRLSHLQSPLYASEASLSNGGVAVAAATLDESAQEATIFESALPAGEWTEELDEKIAAAMGQSLDMKIHAEDSEATVVGITEHDVHPSDVLHGEARATLIGQEYSRSVANPSPRVASLGEQEAAVVEIDRGAQTPDVAGIADIQSPMASAAVASAFPDPPHVASVMAVTSSQDEATVLEIEEDVHPSDFASNEVEATLIQREPHGQSHATMIDRDASCATDRSPPRRPPPLSAGRRTVSAPDTSGYTNPFVDDPNDTPAMSRDGLAALDEADDRVWMSAPPIVGNIILPPPSTRSSSEPLPEANQTTSSSCARDMENSASHSSDFDPPGLPPQRPLGVSDESARIGSDAARTSSTGSVGNSGATSNWSNSQRASLHRFSNRALRSTKDVMEKLKTANFGDSAARRRNGEHINPASCIFARTLLPWSVFHNDSTQMWIATVNTNQKALDSKNVSEASKALKAFSLPTRHAAEEVGLAMAPPRMLPFDSNPYCHICRSKFSVFRRACHCRNCGVCICSGCATARPAKMIPHTYNIKHESTVNICKSCDWLCTAFRTALLNGNQDEAIALYSTGNVNLGTPFANVKGELLFPIHAAVLGGNLALLKWLVDEHCCPIRFVKARERSKSKSACVPIPLQTSKGRSLLGVALTDQRVTTEHKVDIIRYLVVEKEMNLFEEKDLTMNTALLALTAVLHELPRDDPNEGHSHTDQDISAAIGGLVGSFDDPPVFPSVEMGQKDDRAASVVDTTEDLCIICFDNPIDCVITPCGHQICCMQCSSNISTCPVCSVPCSFIRVYKA